MKTHNITKEKISHIREYLAEKKLVYEKRNAEPFLSYLKRVENESFIKEATALLSITDKKDYEVMDLTLKRRKNKCSVFMDGKYTPKDMFIAYNTKFNIINKTINFLNDFDL